MTVSVKVHIFTLLILKIYAPLLYATIRYACKTDKHIQLINDIYCMKTIYLYNKYHFIFSVVLIKTNEA